MIERLQQFLDELVDTMQRFSLKLENIVGNFFRGLLKFIEDTYSWIVETTKKIYEYLVRFFKALGLLIFASFKLSLFYIPTVVLCAISYYRNENLWWIIGLIWFLFITGIGLTYGKDKKA